MCVLTWKRAMTAGLLLIGSGLQLKATEVTTSLDLASAYIFRGITINDKPVLQPTLEINLPVTIGVWGNFNLDDYTPDTKGEFTEIDLYANYTLPLDIKPFGISIGYTEYTYPSAPVRADADREANIGISLDTILSPSLTLYYGLDGAIEKSMYVELGVSHNIKINDDLSCALAGTAAYYNPDQGESGFANATIGMDMSYRIFHLGATYIAQLDDDVLPDVVKENGTPTSLGYDEEFLLTAGISKTF